MNEQQQRALAAGLEALAESSRNESASRRVEQAVMAEAQRVLRPRVSIPRPAADRRWLPLAAALALAVGGALWTARTSAPIPSDGTSTLNGFLVLPSAYGLPDMESASIVRISVPLSALPNYGLPMMTDAGGDSVEADLLVAQDGQPRAIRLVNTTPDSRSRP